MWTRSMQALFPMSSWIIDIVCQAPDRENKIALKRLSIYNYKAVSLGDGSPSYFWELHNWPLLDGNQGCLEPRVVIGQHILHLYPNAKMILTFRHPRTRQAFLFTAENCLSLSTDVTVCEEWPR